MDCIELDEVEGRIPDDPSTISTGELRTIRDELQRAESGLSYVRRVLQGRLDILADERDRRVGGPEVNESQAHQLVDGLSTTLARNTRGGGGQRPPQDLTPPSFAETLLAGYDDAAPHGIGDLVELDNDQLDGLHESLAAAEAEVSLRRRNLHTVIDQLQIETVRRYREGESTVDDLLG